MSVVKIAPGSGGAAPTGVIGMVNNAVAETATIDTRPNSHFRPLDCVFMFILSLSPKEVLGNLDRLRTIYADLCRVSGRDPTHW